MTYVPSLNPQVADSSNTSCGSSSRSGIIANGQSSERSSVNVSANVNGGGVSVDGWNCYFEVQCQGDNNDADICYQSTDSGNN